MFSEMSFFHLVGTEVVSKVWKSGPVHTSLKIGPVKSLCPGLILLSFVSFNKSV